MISPKKTSGVIENCGRRRYCDGLRILMSSGSERPFRIAPSFRMMFENQGNSFKEGFVHRSSARPLNTHRFAPAFLLSAILACVFLAYAPVWHAGFVGDDPDYVTGNANHRTMQGLGRIWSNPSSSHTQYYPLTLTGFWIQYHLWGLNPRGYHLVNLLFHGLNGLLLLFILQRLRCPGSWLAAFLFVLHPMCVESVAWVSEFKNVLSTFFFLLSLRCYLEWALEKEGHSRALYVGAVISFVLALLSKTVTSVLPIIALILVWYRRGRISRADIVPLLPFFMIGSAMAAMTIWVERTLVGAAGEPFLLSAGARVIIAGQAFWFYLGKLVWPYPLMFIYPRWEISSQTAGSFLFPVAALSLLVALWVLRHRCGRGAIAAFLCFTVALFPALGFFNVYPMRFSFVADHFQYLASLAVIGAVAVSMSRWLEGSSKGIRQAGFIVFTCIGMVRR